MKKKYSAPIAEMIEAELGGLLEEVVSFIGVDIDDPHPGPGFGEAKEGVFDAGSKSSSIFDFDE